MLLCLAMPERLSAFHLVLQLESPFEKKRMRYGFLLLHCHRLSEAKYLEAEETERSEHTHHNRRDELRPTSLALSQNMGVTALIFAAENAGEIILRCLLCCSPSVVKRPFVS